MKKIITIFLICLFMVFVKIEVEAAEVSITPKYNNYNQVVSTYSYPGQLTQNTVYGPWDNKYAEYNCYAFAIDRYELNTTYDFNFYNVGYMYEVGTFSNQRDYVNNSENKKDVNIVSNVVIDDLTCLGAINPRKSSTISGLDLEENDSLICVRTSDMDYHFMKYDRNNGYWLHKPGFSHILKLNYSSPDFGNNDGWIHESVNEFGVVTVDNSIGSTYNSSIVYIAFRYETINISCNTELEKTVSIIDPNIYNETDELIDTENDRIITMNVECMVEYRIDIFSDLDIQYYIYDDKMDYVPYELIYEDSPDSKSRVYNLYPGKYYLQVYFENSINNGNIIINIENDFDIYDVYSGVDNNLLEHSHLSLSNNCVAYFEFESEEEGFYKFSLEATDINGQVINFLSGEYMVLNNQFDYITKMNNGNLLVESFNETNEDYMYVYLLSNSKYYFKYNLEIMKFDSLKLNIENINVQDINLFNYISNNSVINLYDGEISNEIFNAYNFEQPGKFELNFVSSNVNEFNIYIYDIDFDINSNNFSQNNIVQLSNYSYSSTNKPSFNLSTGTYYIYISCVGQNKSYDLYLNRKISIQSQDILITDPSKNDLCGSQINIAENEVDIFSRSYRGDEILQGFSRVIYFSNGNSRYDYNWYSSNESVGIVTEHGTILGLSPGNIVIMAINKNNYDIVHFKEFTINNDYSSSIKTISIHDEIEFNDIPYLLKLNVQNCPFPKFSYYNWSISVLSEENSSFNYHINQWGYVTVSKTCDICVIGRYLFNDNYTVLYYLTIV